MEPASETTRLWDRSAPVPPESLSVRPKSPEFLRNAAACRKLARGARVDDRATFLDLAQHWEAMAEIEMRLVATLEVLDADAAPRAAKRLAWPANSQRAA
jgi:hypothetical protein